MGCLDELLYGLNKNKKLWKRLSRKAQKYQVRREVRTQEPQWVDVQIVDKSSRYLNAQLIKTSQDHILLGKNILPFLGMSDDRMDPDVVHLTVKSPDDSLYVACGTNGCMMVVKLHEPCLKKVAPLVAQKQQLQAAQSIQDEQLLYDVLHRLVLLSKRFSRSQSSALRAAMDQYDMWRLQEIENDCKVRLFMNDKYTNILLTDSSSEILSYYWSMLTSPSCKALDLGLQEAIFFQDLALAKSWWKLAVKQRLISEGRAHFNLGQVLSTEDPEAAIHHYKQAFCLEPELRHLIGSTHLLLEEG